jgi:hypothetical protein
MRKKRHKYFSFNELNILKYNEILTKLYNKLNRDKVLELHEMFHEPQ